MEQSPDPPVPLHDAEIARHIARAAAKGGRGDREPTLEQLLAAFDEPAATPDARLRVGAALRVAGVTPTPGIEEAPPGARVVLGFAGPGVPVPRPAGSAAMRRGLAGFAILAAFLGTMALVSGFGGGDGKRVSDLPSGTVTPTIVTTATSPATTTAPTTATTPGTTTQAPAATGTTETGTGTGTTETAPATTTATSTTPATTTGTTKKRTRPTTVAPRRRTVTVRLTAPRPTYLCVDDGAGKILFEGTLSGKRTFVGRRVRLNVGLASTQVTINGKTYALSGSPSGVDITRTSRTPLPLGDRPCS